MVEFALAVPILLMLLLGVLDVGRGVLAAASVANAVREGARAGVVAYPAAGWASQATARARAAAFALDPGGLSVVAALDTSGGVSHVSVSGTYNFRLVAPFITAGVSDIPLNASARMLVR